MTATAPDDSAQIQYLTANKASDVPLDSTDGTQRQPLELPKRKGIAPMIAVMRRASPTAKDHEKTANDRDGSREGATGCVGEDVADVAAIEELCVA